MSVLIADHIVLVSEVGRVRQGISYRNRSQMRFFFLSFSFPRIKTSGLLILFGFRLAVGGWRAYPLGCDVYVALPPAVGSVGPHWVWRKEEAMTMQSPYR